jgi:hypothetical protein
LIPRIEFERLVKETGSEYASKGLSSWSQFVAMMFCQLGRAHLLREIEGGLKSCEGKLAHLGIEAPAKSSLSYANAHRPRQLYEQVFYRLFERVSGSVRLPRKFRFKHKLVSLDSTVIDLTLSVFDWARFGRTKGAVKLHLVLDHDGYLPCYGVITDGSVHDVKVAWRIPFPAGTVVVDDRGYNDYRLFAYWTDAGVFFVTRMKENRVSAQANIGEADVKRAQARGRSHNAQFEVIEEHPVPQNRNILRDQTIRLSGVGAQAKCPHLLRRVEAVREDTGEALVFLTNHHGLGASTVAAIYKNRWAVELFFKALKQNLKIKTFVGTSANAVKIQIWTALIAMLLRYLQLISRFGWSLSNLVALLRMNLFTHRDLTTWLNEPFAAPPDPQVQPQAAPAFA